MLESLVESGSALAISIQFEQKLTVLERTCLSAGDISIGGMDALHYEAALARCCFSFAILEQRAGLAKALVVCLLSFGQFPRKLVCR